MKNENTFLKKTFSIGFLTFISRIFGLLREMVITSFLGTSLYSDAFYLAYTIPNLFRRFTAEGAMLTTFIPIFTKLKKDQGKEKAKKFFRNFFWSLSFLLTLFCLLFIFFTPFLINNIFARGFEGLALEKSIFLTRLMFFYILLISLSAVYQSILNYHSIFFSSAFSPVLLNIIIIVFGFLLGSTMEKAAFGFSIGVLLGGTAQFFYSYFSAYKLQYSIWRKTILFDKKVREIFKKMFGGLFSAGIYQLNIIIGYTIASQLYAGSITSLTISNRLIEFSLGILIVSITTILLPELAKHVVEKKMKLVQEKLQEALLLSSFVTIPAAIGLIVTGEYIIRILFVRGEFDENSLQLTLQALILHAPGLFFIAWNRIFTTNLHSFQFFRKPAYLAFFSMLVNIFFCWYGISFLGHAAIALASSISQAFMLLLHLFFIPKEVKNIWNKKFFLRFSKQIFANIILFVIIYFVGSLLLLENFYLQFFMLFFLAILTYGLSSYFLQVQEIKNIFSLKKNEN